MKVFSHVVPVIAAGCLWVGGNLLIANPVHSQSSELQTYPSCTPFTMTSPITALTYNCAPPVNGKCYGGWAAGYVYASKCSGTSGSANVTCTDGLATQSDPVNGFQLEGYCFAVTSQGQTFCMPSDTVTTGSFQAWGGGIPKCSSSTTP